ncbi:MAG: hypothetical protein A2W91_19285 [Bacteroidetes bacterium GWF2_38_335]|nr:MAG: hypothetical protein A2W91_19285 [Bacteroidetes bacterium GWF2_38_335]OFY79903.1 MAG: hypothetical protein A2281_10685 [Bacteroidetes bacterium RIFOXYA12_FULL_38_20]HBS86359.1 hypothetical protein [Bacteroidales bacterium]
MFGVGSRKTEVRSRKTEVRSRNQPFKSRKAHGLHGQLNSAPAFKPGFKGQIRQTAGQEDIRTKNPLPAEMNEKFIKR